jgi:hypothetical protein
MQCQVDIPPVKGLNDREITVGRVFLLNCKGEWPKNLVLEKLQFKLAETEKSSAKYQIHLLGFEFRSGNEADMKITSYKAGPVQLQNLQLTDGTQTVDLGAVSFETTTVLEKPQEGQAKVEPFGPIGPASIAIPLSYFLIAAFILALLGLLIGRKIYRFSQRRRLLAKLKEHDSALTPVQQFHQNLRALRRQSPIYFGAAVERTHIDLAFEALHQMLRLFLIRELHVPAMEWSDKLILKDTKSYNPAIYREVGLALKKLLNEFDLAQKNRKDLSAQDIVVLTDQSRKLVEGIERAQVAKESRGGR